MFRCLLQNLTGVQSIKIPSPDYKSTTTNPSVMKSYQGYTNMVPSISVATPSYLEKPRKWNVMDSKPPPSPPPSEYDRLIQMELACIKPPIDPDDLINLENRTRDINLDSRKTFCKPITSTVTKEVDFSKFSPHLSSTLVNSTFMLSSEKVEKPTANILNTVQSHETGEIHNSEGYNNCNNYCFDNTIKSGCAHEKNRSCFESKIDCNQTSVSLNHISESLELNLNSFEEQNLNNKRHEKPSNPEKELNLFDRDHNQFLTTDKNCDSNKGNPSKTVNPVNPVSRSLHFDQFEFSKPHELSKRQKSPSAVKYFETKKGTRLFSKNLDSNLSCELNHSLNISNVPPTTKHNSTFTTEDPEITLTSSKEDPNIFFSANKHNETDKKLSVINEIIEKDLSSEDLNSTNSFLLAEQTVIDQDQYILDPQTKMKASRTFLNNKHSIPKVSETSGSYDEIAQAMVKVDTVINNMIRVRSEMTEWDNELKSVKTNLQQLLEKCSKSKDKGTQNKENIPTTETKPMRNKWFNEMKSENPNLLKTPNPARQSVSRMSLANQSIMTPHSLSVVINDQLDDLFD